MSEEAVSAPEESGEQSDETLGRRLRSARESRELSIEKIADELRIEAHVLRALEEDRLSDIKVAPVFIKGYIKQYGRLLDLDYDELREAFQRQADSEDVRLRPNRAIYLRDERQITIWIIAALAVLLVGVALVAWWLGAEEGFSFGSRSGDGDSDSASVAAPVTSRALPSSRQGPAPLSREASDVTAVPAAAEQPASASPAPQRSEAPGEAETDAEADLALAVTQPRAATPVPEDSAREDTAGAPDPIPTEPESGSVAMVFEFSAESWFELTDARGRRIYYDLADAGSRLRFMALPPARVLIGNADAVSITVDFEPYAVPSSSLRGNVASFVIDAAAD
ncbi:MAG: DUF4115 domain-containing protein [Gammaproteobacteria bacterium]|jgi:cytoskeleton protein RodZ